mgnify:FL=1
MKLEGIDISRISTRRNLMQSARWARAKRRQGAEVRPFWLRSRFGEGSVLVVLQGYTETHRAAYLPWGPDLDVPADEQGAFLEELSEQLRRRLPDDLAFLRFDLPWRSPFDREAQEEEGPRQMQPVALPPAWIRSTRLNFGTSRHKLRKAPTDLQPTDTVLIDLTLPDAELLARMRPKTRYNLRLAARRGVEVREEGTESLPEWYGLYRQTMARSNTTLHDYRHFAGLFCLPNDREVGLHLLMARHQGEAIAGIILAIAGDYAVYLYGASGNAGRRHMPTYLLQWEGMTLARRLGADRYDLFGVP